MDTVALCVYDLSDSFILSLAPCPLNTLADLFYELAVESNLTDSDIAQIVARCDIPPPSTTTVLPFAASSTKTSSTMTASISNYSAMTETTSFTFPTTSLENSSLPTPTSVAEPLALSSILIVTIVGALLFVLVLALAFIVKRCRRGTDDGKGMSGLLLTKLSCLPCLAARRIDDPKFFVDIPVTYDEEKAVKIKTGLPGEKGISYISFMDDDLKNVDLFPYFNAIEGEMSLVVSDQNGCQVSETRKSETQEVIGRKVQRKTSILKKGSVVSQRRSSMNKHVRFTDEDESVPTPKEKKKENGQTDRKVSKKKEADNKACFQNCAFETEPEDDCSLMDCSTDHVYAIRDAIETVNITEALSANGSSNVIPDANAVEPLHVRNSRDQQVLQAQQNIDNIMEYALSILNQTTVELDRSLDNIHHRHSNNILKHDSRKWSCDVDSENVVAGSKSCTEEFNDVSKADESMAQKMDPLHALISDDKTLNTLEFNETERKGEMLVSGKEAKRPHSEIIETSDGGSSTQKKRTSIDAFGRVRALSQLYETIWK